MVRDPCRQFWLPTTIGVCRYRNGRGCGGGRAGDAARLPPALWLDSADEEDQAGILDRREGRSGVFS
jgi:hypothetical protein